MRYWAYSNDFAFGQWSYTNLLIGAQGNYHFRIDNPKWDLWGGLVLAYDAGSVKYGGTYGDIYPHPSSGGVWLSIQGGARYWVSNNFGVTGRLGFGTLSYSALEFGVDWKI